MGQTREELNRFLVDAFHAVLRAEERCLRQACKCDLSISEMHVIEAVENAARAEGGGAASVARRLGITPGSLSTALSALERKGYLLRRRDQKDRRRVRIHLTDKGLKAGQAHRRVHERMVDAVMAKIGGGEAGALRLALQAITQLFGEETPAF